MTHSFGIFLGLFKWAVTISPTPTIEIIIPKAALQCKTLITMYPKIKRIRPDNLKILKVFIIIILVIINSHHMLFYLDVSHILQ
jgi:hypothetical protein